MILMDVAMPIMDGITATAELRRRGNDTLIIGLTANADDETRLDAMRSGMDELLTKPISVTALRRVAGIRRFSADSKLGGAEAQT